MCDLIPMSFISQESMQLWSSQNVVMASILKNKSHLEMYLYHSCMNSIDVNKFSKLYNQYHIIINRQKKIHMEMVVNGGHFEKCLRRLPYWKYRMARYPLFFGLSLAISVPDFTLLSQSARFFGIMLLSYPTSSQVWTVAHHNLVFRGCNLNK